MKNFPQFIKCGAKLFAGLYENFPEPISVSLADDTKESQNGPAVAMGTVRWLRDNGYVRAVEESDVYFDNVILTKQGLNFLQVKCGLGELSMDDFENAMRSFIE